MSFPTHNLPTDSLYKFVVVSCLLLLAAKSFFLNETRKYMEELNINRFQASEERINTKFDRFFRSSVELKEILSGDDLGKYRGEIILELQENLKLQNEDVKRSVKIAEDMYKTSAIKRGNAVSRLESEFNYQKWSLRGLYLLLLLSFLYWFLYGQRHHDRKLKYETEMAELQLEKMKNSMGDKPTEPKLPPAAKPPQDYPL